MTTSSTSSTAPNSPINNDQLSSPPHINPDLSKSKGTSGPTPILPTNLIIINSRISTYPICSPIPSSNPKLSMRNSTSKNHQSFPKRMTTAHLHVMEKILTMAILTLLKIFQRQPSSKANHITHNKKNQDPSKKDSECSLIRLMKLSPK